mgnify:CR=1 FL=1
MAQIEYCNLTTDIYRAYPRIEEFKVQKTMRGWVLHSGSVYKKANVGYGEMLFENNLPMAAVASVATIAAGKFYYDAANDILYAQSTTGTMVTTTNAYLWGVDWDTLKEWAVEQASGRIEALLDQKFPIPIPENSRGTSTQHWDLPIIQATALMACSLIVSRQEPMKFNPDGSGANAAADLFLAAKSIVDQYNAGTMAFSWELTKDEIGSYYIVPGSSNTSVGMFQLRGAYNGAEDETWVIKIITGGALATATYKLSQDNGATYGSVVTTLATHAWQTLGNGLEIRFFDRGATTTAFIADNTWQIFLTASTNSQSRSGIGSIKLIG